MRKYYAINYDLVTHIYARFTEEVSNGGKLWGAFDNEVGVIRLYFPRMRIRYFLVVGDAPSLNGKSTTPT